MVPRTWNCKVKTFDSQIFLRKRQGTFESSKVGHDHSFDSKIFVLPHDR